MLKCLLWRKQEQICSILLIIKMLDQKLFFWGFPRTLVIDVLWRQSMLQINGCGGKINAYN